MKLKNAHIAPTIPVTDIEKAKRFYGEKLGLDLCTENRDRGELLYEAGDGTHVLVYQRRTPTVSDATAMTFLVDDVRQTADWLRDRGISFEDYEMPRMGIKTERGIADMNGDLAAWFQDPDGNILAITETKETARILAGECEGAAVA
jgi:catechol 2,3-dioxygenase-like lactoylglutathione lyase family enzyme